jgi:hypothetical protein
MLSGDSSPSPEGKALQYRKAFSAERLRLRAHLCAPIDAPDIHERCGEQSEGDVGNPMEHGGTRWRGCLVPETR